MDLIELSNKLLNNKIAFEEILGFPAHLLPELPLRTILVIESEWWKTPVVFVVNDQVGDQGHGYPIFDGKEFATIVRGVENDRVWSTDLRGWCNLKARDSAWRVKESEVMGGVANPDYPGWALEKILKRIEATPRFLEVGPY